MSAHPNPSFTRAARLIELRNNTGLSQRDVADRLTKSGYKISAVSLSFYERDDSIKIKKPLLTELAKLYKTTVAYIETGKHPTSEEATTPTQKSEVSFVHPASMEDYIELPAVPVLARASFIEMAGVDTSYPDLDTMRAYNPSPELRKPGSISIEINGDSMEPQLRSGMWVAAYPIDPSDFKYASSGVYVVDYGSSLVIKRIKDNDLLEKGILTLYSDNERAGRMSVEASDLRRLWRVVDIVKGRVV